jgi:MSHA biogenesis protein MshP
MITSVFVLVIMLLLGLALNRVLTASSEALANEAYGLRALNAARTGIELNVATVFDPALNGTLGSCGAIGQAFDAVQGLQNCRFDSQCSLITFGSISYYQFSSVGSCSVDPTAQVPVVVSRRVSIDAQVGGN